MASQLGGLVHVPVSPLTLASVRITLHLHSMLLLSLRLIKNDNELGKGQHVPFSVLLACSLSLSLFLSLARSLSLSRFFPPLASHLLHSLAPSPSLFSSCIERGPGQIAKKAIFIYEVKA